MPQITIDLSEEAYALIKNRASGEARTLEEEAAEILERSLAMTFPEGIERWSRFGTAVTSIQGFLSTLRLDEDGTMFEHPDRLEFCAIMERECNQLREPIEVISLMCIQNDRYRVQPTSLRAVLEAVRDRALTSLNRKPNHRFILELGDNLPETFLTDEQALAEMLWGFLEQAIVHTPEGSEIRVQIRNAENKGLTFNISHRGRGISPEFVRKFGQQLSFHSPPERGGGGHSFRKDWFFIRWHGGTCEVTSSESDGETTFSFTLPPATESNYPLWDDPIYRATLAALRHLCIRLLAGTEQVATRHAQFDHEARQALATGVQTECDALIELVQSLSRQ